MKVGRRKEDRGILSSFNEMRSNKHMVPKEETYADECGNDIYA